MVLREKAVLFDLGYLEEERVVIYVSNAIQYFNQYLY